MALLPVCATTPLFATAQPKTQLADDCVTIQQLYRSGHDVSAPKLIHSVEPNLSQAARQSKEPVSVLVNFCVGTDGSTSNWSVVRVEDNKSRITITNPDSNPILKELEESAVEATKQYKFEAAKKNGKPVKVALTIVINFQEN